MRNLLANSLLVIASALLSLTAAELILRQTNYAYIAPMRYGYPSNYFVKDAINGYDIGISRPKQVHEISNASYEIFSNSLGCFDYERKVPDNYALTLGDSFTWGFTPLPYKWTTKLEELSKHFVLKCGVTGYGPLQEITKAKKIAKAVGKHPKYLIVLYTGNDFNDDFLFPQSTVHRGFLTRWIKYFDLATGEVVRYSEAELEERYQNKYGNTLVNKIDDFFETLLITRIYKRTKHNFLNKRADPTLLPNGRYETIYRPNLLRYLNQYDHPWYNKAFDVHEAALIALVNYAKSIHAKLLFIDKDSSLMHKRFDRFRNQFDNSRLFYYNLAQWEKRFPTWPNDGHWNVEGNQKAAKDIYQHIQQIHFFE